MRTVVRDVMLVALFIVIILVIAIAGRHHGSGTSGITTPGGYPMPAPCMIQHNCGE